MKIHQKEEVVLELEKHLSVILTKIPTKQIIYSGKDAVGKTIIVCTPKSKLHSQGYGWVDLTLIQKTLLQEGDHSILALRIEGGKTYYLNFMALEPYLNADAMINNNREGDHWKLRIWPSYIEVLGNPNHVLIKPNDISSMDL